MSFRGLSRWLTALMLLAVDHASATTATLAEAKLAAAVHEIGATLQRWDYPAVAGVVALDYVGVPVPADTMLVAATLAAGRGDLRLPVVVLLAVAAMIGGSQAGFCLGRWRALLRRLPLARARMAAVLATHAGACGWCWWRHSSTACAGSTPSLPACWEWAGCRSPWRTVRRP